MKPAAFLLLILAAAPAAAHEGAPHTPGWTLDAWVTGPLLLGAGLYLVGFVRLWRRSGPGRAALKRDAILFGLGWLTLAAALVSPLHEAGGMSFAMHMIEHELIMLVAALLIVAGRPGTAFLWA
ncbi:MAG: cytochrome c oxidase assembly protein, partial [Pseudomonadota bacterium]|nr:cytochrome c oxidase assembly protein [Pseudomonadota bacterium]